MKESYVCGFEYDGDDRECWRAAKVSAAEEGVYGRDKKLTTESDSGKFSTYRRMTSTGMSKVGEGQMLLAYER